MCIHTYTHIYMIYTYICIYTVKPENWFLGEKTKTLVPVFRFLGSIGSKLFLANFDLLPPVTLCHTSRDPPKSTSHISDPPFLVGLLPKTRTKPLYKFSLNCSR